MPAELIPDDVREFIINEIDSIVELEALLILCKNSETEWSVRDLSERLYAGESQTQQALAKLHSSGFLTTGNKRPTAYRYEPKTQEQREMVGRVAEIYSKFLIPVTNLIHAKSENKVQQFADAFKLRKRTDK